MAAGFVTWAASFLIRSHGMDVPGVGVALGVGLGTAIAVGSRLGECWPTGLASAVRDRTHS